MILQEPFHGIDADDGSMFETDFSPASKGENNADLSWTGAPVSPHLLIGYLTGDVIVLEQPRELFHSLRSSLFQTTRGFGCGSPESHHLKESPFPSPKSTPRNSLNSCHSPDAEDATDLVAAATASRPA